MRRPLLRSSTKPRLLLAVGTTSVAVLLFGAGLWATHDTAPSSTVGAAAANAPECGRRIVEDWYGDGRVGRLYPLACYHAAIDLMPADMGFSSAREDIGRALDLARTGRIAPVLFRREDVFGVKVGMTRMQVRKLAGIPDRAGVNCWLYRASKPGEPNVTGMRICFTGNHVSLAQINVHA